MVTVKQFSTCKNNYWWKIIHIMCFIMSSVAGQLLVWECDLFRVLVVVRKLFPRSMCKWIYDHRFDLYQIILIKVHFHSTSWWIVYDLVVHVKYFDNDSLINLMSVFPLVDAHKYHILLFTPKEKKCWYHYIVNAIHLQYPEFYNIIPLKSKF